jgi:hypothetical protein
MTSVQISLEQKESKLTKRGKVIPSQALIVAAKRIHGPMTGQNHSKTEVPAEAGPHVVFDRGSPRVPECKPGTQLQRSPAF